MNLLRMTKLVPILSNLLLKLKVEVSVAAKGETNVPSRSSFIPSKELNAMSSMNFVLNGSRIKLQIHAPFKWYRLQAAFSSVFSGSSDRLDSHTPRIDEICKYINQISTHTPVNLISVIGGNYYLDLMSKLEVKSLILFDSNYLEIVKTSFIIDHLRYSSPPGGGGETSASEFQAEVESKIAEYVDVISRRSGVNIEFEQLPTSKWNHHGLSKDSFPILLRKEDYPKHAFSIGSEDPEVLNDKLKRALKEDFWLDLPRINMNREFTVVFLSNIVEEDISDLDVKKRIVNHSGLVIVRSNDDGSKTSINDKALEPHPFWMAILSSCLKIHGTYLKAFEILPPELRKLTDINFQILENNFDAFFCEGVGLLGEVVEAELSCFNAVVTHMLFGKIRSGKELTSRIESVRNLFLKIPANVRRIVVCEFHPESTRAAHLREDIGNLEKLYGIYQELLPEFSLTELKESPGFLEEKRNSFLIFDRLN